jgi:hypothetical protein
MIVCKYFPYLATGFYNDSYIPKLHLYGNLCMLIGVFSPYRHGSIFGIQWMKNIFPNMNSAEINLLFAITRRLTCSDYTTSSSLRASVLEDIMHLLNGDVALSYVLNPQRLRGRGTYKFESICYD